MTGLGLVWPGRLGETRFALEAHATARLGSAGMVCLSTVRPGTARRGRHGLSALRWTWYGKEWQARKVPDGTGAASHS